MKTDRTQIKVCGLTQAADAVLLNENEVDFAGMVLFFEKSRRNITIGRAAEIIAALSEKIKKVAVVVSPNVQQLREIEDTGFDYIQIHGTMLPEVYEAAQIPIIRAVNVPAEGLSETYMAELSQLTGAEKIAGILFDAGKPGSGETFDWQLIQSVQEQVRAFGKWLFLAGGLNDKNVAEAIRKVRPDVVDVSSGVEYQDCGKIGKDPARVRAFAAQARKKIEI